MRIGIPRSQQDDFSFYRTYAVIVELRQMGHTIETFNPADRASYAKCDWIFSHMLFGKGADKVIQMAQEMKCKIWVDIDDNIFHVPFSNRSFEHHMDRSKQKYILEQCDLITVSTKPLYALMENFLMSDNILLLENYLWIEGFTPPRTDGKKVIAWRGGDHTEDFLHIITELHDLEQVADEIHYFGGRPQGYTPGGRTKVVWHPYTDTWNYLKLLKQVNPVVVFGYWADIPFNTCKSDVMWQEATRAGAVLVMNDGWDAFGGMPHIRYADEDICKAVKFTLSEPEIAEKQIDDSIERMEVKRQVRIEQSQELSQRINSFHEQLLGGGVTEMKTIWQNTEKDVADTHPDVISDQERCHERSVEHTYKNEINIEVMESFTEPTIAGEDDGDVAFDQHQEDDL